MYLIYVRNIIITKDVQRMGSFNRHTGGHFFFLFHQLLIIKIDISIDILIMILHPLYNNPTNACYFNVYTVIECFVNNGSIFD
jgi:hypothetical protein